MTRVIEQKIQYRTDKEYYDKNGIDPQEGENLKGVELRIAETSDGRIIYQKWDVTYDIANTELTRENYRQVKGQRGYNASHLNKDTRSTDQVIDEGSVARGADRLARKLGTKFTLNIQGEQFSTEYESSNVEDIMSKVARDDEVDDDEVVYTDDQGRDVTAGMVRRELEGRNAKDVIAYLT